MNIDKERELFEGTYPVPKHVERNGNCYRANAQYAIDAAELQSARWQAWQARAAIAPEWISVSGYKEIPEGEWLVYMPDAREQVQSCRVNMNNICTIGSLFAFDAKEVTAYREKPLPQVKG